MRTFNIGAVILEENWEGYRDWAEALGYYVETDAGAVSTPSLAYESYATTGQRQHLLLTIDNTSGSTQSTRISAPGNGLGVWVHNTVLTTVEVTMSFQYKASAGLAGATATFGIANSPFGQTAGAVVVGDDAWHPVTATWSMQADGVLFTGQYLEVAGITDGMEGTVRIDDVRLVRVGAIMREIDSAAPIVALRADWADGFRETYGWTTNVQRHRDGSEYRESLRLIPTCRLEYTVVTEDPARSGLVDQFLYRYHGAIVAVPRWADAVPLVSVISSGHVVNVESGSLTSRWFQPRQRFMIWQNETTYEAEIIDTIPDAQTLTVDPLVGEVAGSFSAGAWVVPLVPARLAADVALGRPNNRLGVYPLAFDVQMVQ